MDKLINTEKMGGEPCGDYIIERFREIQEPIAVAYGDYSGEITIHEKIYYNPLPPPPLKPWEIEKRKKDQEVFDFYTGITKRTKLINYSKLPQHIQDHLLYRYNNRGVLESIVNLSQTYQEYCKKEFKVETSK